MTPRRFAVVGDPIAHSKSPAMHAAAYRALGMPHTYTAVRARAEELAGIVDDLRRGFYDGLNVTVPHKMRILDHVDRCDGHVTLIGAANTLVRAAPLIDDSTIVPGVDPRRPRIVAHNTDVPALAAELRRLAPERTVDDWRRSRAIVLGSGGAARSAIAALALELGVVDVIVRARSAGALESMGGARFVTRPLEAVPAIDAEALTIVQATSAGMTGAAPGDGVAAAIAWRDLPPRAVALDVVYAPPVTPFLRAASEHGVRNANGLGMLAMQGALAFELWLGTPAPYGAMLSALA